MNFVLIVVLVLGFSPKVLAGFSNQCGRPLSLLVSGSQPETTGPLAGYMDPEDFFTENSIKLDSFPDNLKDSIKNLEVISRSDEQLLDGLAKIMLAHLQGQGVQAELLYPPADSLALKRARPLIRILPIIDGEAPHWLNSVAAQLSKEAENHSLIFDPIVALSSTPFRAFYSKQLTSLRSDYQENYIGLSIRDLHSNKMTDSGVHEWIHYMVAYTNYVKGETYQGWADIQLRPKGFFSTMKVRKLYDRAEKSYRDRHTVDEIYAHFRQLQVKLKNLEHNIAADPQDYSSDLKSAQRTLDVVKSLGEYDAYVLSRILIEINKNKLGMRRQFKTEMKLSTVFAYDKDFEINIPSKLFKENAKGPGGMSTMAQIVESQIAEINKVLAHAEVITKRLVEIQKTLEGS